MIEVESLTQRYGPYVAVRDLSFAVQAGEVVGFLGPNGAGKSTTLKVLAAYLAPSEGRVTVGGFDASREPDAVHAVLGYLPEHTPLYDDMLARDLLAFVAQVRGLSRAQRAVAVGRVAERCQLGEVLDRPVRALSKGFRQRVGIAQALIHDPPVVVLDEPTSGLDPHQVQEMRSLVGELGQDRTVLFSSHVLAEVEATCRRVVVIHRGRKVADGEVTELANRVTGGQVTCRFVEARADDAASLASLEGVAAAAPLDGGDGAPARELLVTPAPGVDDLAARLFRHAAAQGRVLDRLAPRRATLEDVFAALTGEEERD